MNSNFENMVYKFYLDRRQIAYYFNNACLIIAYLDNNIKFTITDYYNYYRRNHTLNYALQEVVRLLLNEARMKNTDTTKIFNFLTAELNRCKQEDTNEFINSIYRISYRYPEINLKISKKKYRKANENQSKGEIIIKETKFITISALKIWSEIKKTLKRSFNVYLGGQRSDAYQ